MSAAGLDTPESYDRLNEPTPAHVWHSVAGSPVTDELLEWPPDIFALTNVILSKSEAFRFALVPVGHWPPSRYGDWSMAVEEAGRQWSSWVDNRRGEIPELVLQEWRIFNERAGVPLEHVAAGHEQRLCEALLTLHAIADEACAGVGIALDSSDGEACVYRARGRELLVRTGSLSRINPHFMRVLPKVVTPPTGRPAFSRYACVQGPGISARWHKVPTRHRGTDITSEFATLLLLPWPMRVRESDFHPLEGSVQRLTNEPFGFFNFAPAESLDLDLLDRVLVAAREEVNSVDVVLLPESAIDEEEIAPLEDLLHRHGVNFVHAGIRERSKESGQLPGNWMLSGINPRLEKGAKPPSETGEPWFRIRQNKHHRWSLDESQIYQYHLGGVLHPDVRWWEAIDLPRLEVNFIEVAEVTLVGLVCQDLAHNDDVAGLIRSVGPTIVVTALLDGPQLTSRWAARYASVLADDPGSAVLTLTSFGMAERSRPHGHDASPIIALWKDPSRGVREIRLDPGAYAVVLTVCMSRSPRRSADSRWPVDNGTAGYDVAVHQVKPTNTSSEFRKTQATEPTSRVLEVDELTILTAWAEGVAEVLAHAPGGAPSLLAEARSGAAWRDVLGLAEPSAQLSRAIDAMSKVVMTAGVDDSVPTFESVLSAASAHRQDASRLDATVRQVLRAMLEERQTRHGARRTLGPAATTEIGQPRPSTRRVI